MKKKVLIEAFLGDYYYEPLLPVLHIYVERESEKRVFFLKKCVFQNRLIIVNSENYLYICGCVLRSLADFDFLLEPREGDVVEEVIRDYVVVLVQVRDAVIVSGSLLLSCLALKSACMRVEGITVILILVFAALIFHKAHVLIFVSV